MSPMFLSISDYLAQGTIAALVFVYPWFLRTGQAMQAFLFPSVAILAWGFWRLLVFDPRTANDIPGAGYLASAFLYSFLALLMFGIRRALSRRRSRLTEPKKS